MTSSMQYSLKIMIFDFDSKKYLATILLKHKTLIVYH